MKVWLQFALSGGLLLLLLSCATYGPGQLETWEQDTIVKRIRAKRAEKQAAAAQTDRGDQGESEAGTDASTRADRRRKPIQDLLIEGAHFVKGKDELVVRGKRFNMDCTGTVLAIYYYAGIDLAKDFAKYTGNGVLRLFSYLRDHGLLHDKKQPSPGDIIFWDDTYDKNGDGIWNDEFTHTGMVVAVSQWGTMDYVHLNYRKGIVFERMNLLEPDVHIRDIDGDPVTINSAMRMKDEPTGSRWLASHLFRIFGKGYKLPPD
jgi:hypothetical protein